MWVLCIYNNINTVEIQQKPKSKRNTEPWCLQLSTILLSDFSNILYNEIMVVVKSNEQLKYWDCRF
jgi:hypothetical protein